MGSSGVRATDRTEHRECDACEFAGEVTVLIDPESHTTFWEGPCGHQHESTTWDDYDNSDEDA